MLLLKCWSTSITVSDRANLFSYTDHKSYSHGCHDGLRPLPTSWCGVLNIVQEESFGPIVGIQKVASDEEAIKLMNDSPYGLTASVWTNAAVNPDSEEAFLKFVDEIEAGTVFLNRFVASVALGDTLFI